MAATAAVAGRWRWMDPLARATATLLVLNVVDGLFTVLFLQLQLAVEANPVMRLAYEASPVTFMAVKLALVQGGAWLLWSNRNWSAARIALRAGVVLYALIVVYHLSFACWLAAGAPR
jgi:hypothetical protein